MSGAATMQLLAYLAVLLLLAWPLGRAIEAVMQGRLALVRPAEALLWRVAGVQAEREHAWSAYALGLLVFNGLGVAAVYALQRLQDLLPLNPQSLPAVSPDSAFNTAISFVTNTNWQGYGGEATMSYLTQMLALTVQNFLSAATGIVVVVALVRGFARHGSKQTATLGNVWVDLTRVTLWILLPLSLAFALVMAGQGVIQNLKPYAQVNTVEAVTWTAPKLDAQGAPLRDTQGQPVLEEQRSSTQQIAMGPVASQLAIKMIGTNGCRCCRSS